jgi:hypothetical protein
MVPQIKNAFLRELKRISNRELKPSGKHMSDTDSKTEEKPEVKGPLNKKLGPSVIMSAVFGKIEQFDNLNGDLENYFERFEQFL